MMQDSKHTTFKSNDMYSKFLRNPISARDASSSNESVSLSYFRAKTFFSFSETYLLKKTFKFEIEKALNNVNLLGDGGTLEDASPSQKESYVIVKKRSNCVINFHVTTTRHQLFHHAFFFSFIYSSITYFSYLIQNNVPFIIV